MLVSSIQAKTARKQDAKDSQSDGAPSISACKGQMQAWGNYHLSMLGLTGTKGAVAVITGSPSFISSYQGCNAAVQVSSNCESILTC